MVEMIPLGTESMRMADLGYTYYVGFLVGLDVTICRCDYGP